jgi:hypothetical protein
MEIRENILNFQHRILKTLHSGVFVRFTCEPVAVKTNETIRVIAAFFSPPDRPFDLVYFPRFQCIEAPEIEGPLSMMVRTDSEVQFEGRLEAQNFRPGNYTLALWLNHSEQPIASTTVHILGSEDVQTLKSWFTPPRG